MSADPTSGDAKQTGIAPAIQEAQADATPPKTSEQEELEALHKKRDALLLDPGNPQHALYLQALKGLELLGGDRFKDRKELERVALFMAMQASAIGLARIDKVAMSDDGAGYFFVDDHAVDPAMRGYVTHAQAVQPGAEQQLVQARLQQDQRAAQDQQRNTQQVQRDVQQSERVEQQRRQDPPQRLL